MALTLDQCQICTFCTSDVLINQKFIDLPFVRVFAIKILLVLSAFTKSGLTVTLNDKAIGHGQLRKRSIFKA